MAELQKAEITARIKQARKEAGLTQPELAELLDVTPRTYQNYESTRVPWSLIAKIAEATGTSTRWLLHGVEDEPAPMIPVDLMDKLNEMTQRLDALDQMKRRLDGIEAALSVSAGERLERELERGVQPSPPPGDSSAGVARAPRKGVRQRPGRS